MKKITKLAITALLSLGAISLASCGGSETSTPAGSTPAESTSQVANAQEEAKVNAALESLSVPSTVANNFSLTTVGVGGVAISWASDNAAIVVDGSTATVNRSLDGDVNVKLTATATLGEVSKQREFTVTVQKMEVNVETISIREVFNAAIGTEVTTRGIVVQILCTAYQSTARSGFYIADGDYAIYVFGSNTADKVELGDEVIIKGKAAAYPTDITSTNQISSPDLVATLRKDAKVSGWDTSKLEKATVAEINTKAAKTDGVEGKVYYMENIRINKYVTSYTSMSIYDWKDTPSYSSDPKINLYSSQGDFGMPEYSHWDAYLDKPVNIIFVVNSTNSSGKWRGSIIDVVSVVE